MNAFKSNTAILLLAGITILLRAHNSIYRIMSSKK